ncbi:hypothetical protein JI739_04580 [Ramlibacter sp. AW1]|uniref:Uncharacterized protein n=1 Tax=Ramlibacter aurantiacus TaxID=2801330 RepID=A0A936ZLU9_9BURK|nr:hypothetical protein [Ramlibacter aurantiacus]MBL0419620.1 hypothetical protein [Ramlibacter aurantiacus]
MSGLLTVAKYVAGLLGIPALTTALSVASAGVTAKKSLETTVNFTSRTSARLQMLPEESHLKSVLDTVLVLNARGTYGEDRAYFTVSGADGAMKMLDGSGPGDLYIVEITAPALNLSGHKYLVYAKSGMVERPGSVRLVKHLAKRSETVDTANLTDFLGALGQAMVEQHDRVEQMKRSGMRP